MVKLEPLCEDYRKELREDADFVDELSEPPLYWKFKTFLKKYKDASFAVETLNKAYEMEGWLNYKELVLRGILRVHKDENGRRPDITVIN